MRGTHHREITRGGAADHAAYRSTRTRANYGKLAAADGIGTSRGMTFRAPSMNVDA